MGASVFMELAVSACATTFPPGPNNILLLSSTSTFGFRKCRPLLLGIWAGLITVMLICGFGCAALGSLLFPLYKKYAQVINTVMALLLVWCAWKIVKT